MLTTNLYLEMAIRFGLQYSTWLVDGSQKVDSSISLFLSSGPFKIF